MIAIAAALAQIIVILIHRRRAAPTATRTTPWPYMAAALAACAGGWLVIGLPAIVWGDLFLALMCGVLLGSEAARAAKELSGRTWAGWATACTGGAASATWLLDSPLPFTTAFSG
ncbi:hypothetical protein [Streptomyces sp. NPDC048462]|uniref:hypothetical protein n=1 Tax=Streptomyces sp. NPDC048462 TaxID=3365555 RepID=UPI003715C591